jgi:LuxR family maltose regulon positive regulatory protein
LPAFCLIERAYALEHLAGAHLWRGDEKQARQLLYDALAGSAQPDSEYDGRLLTALGLLAWTTTDLSMLRQTAARCVELADEIGSADSIMYGQYLSGLAYYDANDLPKAETFLNNVVTNKRTPNSQYFAQSAFALASVYQANGLSEQANEIANLVCEQMLKLRNTVGLSEALSFQAELALRQGHLVKAVGWAQQFDSGPLQPVYKFYVPVFTQAKVLIAENSTKSRKRAGDLLRQLVMVQTHNSRFQITVLGLQALLWEAQGDAPAAQEALQKAVLLAQPGGCVRLFADLGAGLKPLLHQLDLGVEGSGYVARILAAFPDTQTENSAAIKRSVMIKGFASCQPLPDPLTRRELQVLTMLSERLSSKEISERLCISSATVKRHRENIYQKLGVHGHREAVSRAQELALVPDNKVFPI